MSSRITFGAAILQEKYLFIFLTCCAFLLPELAAQPTSPRFRRLKEADQFPQDRMTAILRDSYGFMWFGTDLGLLRYDGYIARRYRHSPNDSSSLAGSQVNAIYEDRTGRFWVGTNGGLNLMDRKRGTFQRFRHLPEDPHSISSNNIWCIYQDREDRLWVGSDRGLDLFEDGRFRHFQRHSDEEDASITGVTALIEDASGSLVIGTNSQGLATLGPDQSLLPDSRLPMRKISALCLDQTGGIWVGTLDNGLYFRDQRHKWRHFLSDPSKPESLPSSRITSLSLDYLNRLWIGTQDGLSRYRGDGSFFNMYYDENDDQSPRHNHIRVVYCDMEELLWVATQVGGVDQLSQASEAMRVYDVHQERGAWAITQFREGLFVGTMRGLAYLDLEEGIQRWFLRKEAIRSVHPVSNDHVLVGTNQKLLRLDLSSADPSIDVLLENFTFWSIVPWQGNQFLLGTEKGLLLYDLENRKLLDLPLSNGSNPLENQTITSILTTDDGFWVGTFFGGLLFYDQLQQSLTQYVSRDGDNTSLSANDVMDILIDHNHRIWVATLSGGINRFIPSTGSFERYTMEKGFLDNAITGLLQDSQNKIWAHTAEGLVRFNPDNMEEHVYYTGIDGVASGGATVSCYRLNDDLFFGGTTGLLRVELDKLPYPKPPKLLFTSLLMGSREVLQLLEPGEQITVDYREKVFSLEVALLDFRANQGRSLSYQRMGLEDGWVTGAGKATVGYTRYLSYGGEGLLRIQGSNHHGISSEGELKLLIQPPPWWRWLPLIVITALALLIWLIYTLTAIRERHKRRELQQQARLAEQRRELAEQRALVAERQNEVEQKARLLQEERTAILQEHLEQVSTEIANDMHDGPLAELNGLGFRIHQLLQSNEINDLHRELEDVSRGTLPRVCGTLRNFCGQLLQPDFEYGLVTELESYADVVGELYPQLSITCHFDDQSFELTNETQAGLYRIYRTLLKNAGQHAEADDIEVNLLIMEEMLELRIIDNGKGFVVPENWEDFRREKHYGMYMANYFAESLGGSLQVDSELGRGTRIFLKLPLKAQLEQLEEVSSSP